MEIRRETVDLAKLFKIIRKRIVMIIIFSSLGLIISGAIAFKFITPMYQVKTQLLVHSSRENNQNTAQEIQGNIQIINTYNEILVSPVVLDQVINRIHLNTNVGDLQKNVKLSTETDSQVITMAVQNEDKFKARDIANTTVDVFKNEVSRIMNVDNVAVLAPASVTPNMGPVSPNKKLSMAIGTFAGLMIGLIIAILLDFFDKTIKNVQDLEDLLALPVLGEIPEITVTDMEAHIGKEK